MMITSCFNRRYLSSTLIGIPLGILTLAGISSFKTPALIATVLVTAGFSLVGILGYLCWLRRITIVSDGIETQSVLLPFWRRYYRFAEFDYSETSSTRNGEVLRLIKDGRRVISISSSLYQNFEQLCHAIAVKEKEPFQMRDPAEVVSEFNRLHLYGSLVFGLFSVVLMALMPYGQYVSGKEVKLGLILFSLFGVFLFGGLLLAYLFPYQHITVWHGQVDVRRLLWPFQVKHYLLSDFDGCYYVTVKSNGQLGSKDEEMRWFTKNGKVVLDIEEGIYRNFEALKNAMRTNFLGRLELTTTQAMKYGLGKKIQL